MATKVTVDLDDSKFSGSLGRIQKGVDLATGKLSSMGKMLTGGLGLYAASKGADAFRGALSIMTSEGSVAGEKLRTAFSGVQTAMERLADDPAVDSFINGTADAIQSRLIPAIASIPDAWRSAQQGIGGTLAWLGEQTGVFADGTVDAYNDTADAATKSLTKEREEIVKRNKALRDAKALRDLDNADQDRAFARRLKNEGLGMTNPAEQEENIRLQREALTADGLTDEAKQRINRSIQKSLQLLEEYERQGERLAALDTSIADAKKAAAIEEAEQRQAIDEQAIRDGEDKIVIEEMLGKKAAEASKNRTKLLAEQADIETKIKRMREAGSLTEAESAKANKRITELFGQQNKSLNDQIAAEREINALRKEREALAKAEMDRMNEIHARMRDQQLQKERDRAEKRVDALAGAFGGPRGGGLGGMPGVGGGGGPEGQQGRQQGWLGQALAAWMPGRMMPRGGDGAQLAQGGGAGRNPADRLVDALNPDAIRRRVMQAKLDEIAKEKQGRDLRPQEERAFRLQEQRVRRDAMKGIVGGKGGINEEDVAKAIADEAGKQIDRVAKQQKLNAETIEALKKAAKVAAEAAAETAEANRAVEQINGMLDKVLPLMRGNGRARAMAAGRGP